MLRLTLEVVPQNDESSARVIGRLRIWNQDERLEVAEYGYEINEDLPDGGGGDFGGGKIVHQRRSGAWSLVQKTLDHWLGRSIR